jgi:hypothetical protein
MGIIEIGPSRASSESRDIGFGISGTAPTPAKRLS